MSEIDITPQESLEDSGDVIDCTSNTNSNASSAHSSQEMDETDSTLAPLLAEEDVIEQTTVTDLSATAAADEALWNDEHTSDEAPFEPEAEEKEGDESGDEKGSDEDSSDEIELECPNHDKCVALAREVDALICTKAKSKTSKKTRQAALCEVLCDNFVA